jgi:hypothetical protein
MHGCFPRRRREADIGTFTEAERLLDIGEFAELGASNVFSPRSIGAREYSRPKSRHARAIAGPFWVLPEQKLFSEMDHCNHRGSRNCWVRNAFVWRPNEQ